jgi:hypothetical protein
MTFDRAAETYGAYLHAKGVADIFKKVVRGENNQRDRAERLEAVARGADQGGEARWAEADESFCQ